MNVFYATDIIKDKITLRDQEAQHCARVLRKGRGAEVFVIDGKGSRYRCEIDEIKRQTVELSVLSYQRFDPNPGMPHIAFGIMKNMTRLEILLEKITEIGVSEISPIICTRSERTALNMERLEKILISAIKQSLNFYLPVFHRPRTLEDFISAQSGSKRFIASFGPGVPELSSIQGRHENPVMLIGPEGDFTENELSLAIDADFKRVNLGSTRLRAETAAIVACTLLRY